MRPVRTIVAVLFAAAIAITGCTVHTSADQPSPPPSAPNPTHTPRQPTHRTDPTSIGRTPVDHTPVDQQAQIYPAVLRQYLTSGDAAIAADHRFPQIFVIDHAVPGAGASGHGASGHGASGDGPIPPGARRAITHALTDVGPLTFVASGEEVIVEPHGCAHVRDDGILITLGPVDGSGDRVQVGVNGFLACLGANSLTYSVQQTSSGWMVSGITALGPVA
jgi:hypothetical protein